MDLTDKMHIRTIVKEFLDELGLLKLQTATKFDGEIKYAVRIPTAAAALDVDRNTIYNMIKRGQIAAVKVGERLRIPVSELERFNTANRPVEKDRRRGPQLKL